MSKFISRGARRGRRTGRGGPGARKRDRAVGDRQAFPHSPLGATARERPSDDPGGTKALAVDATWVSRSPAATTCRPRPPAHPGCARADGPSTPCAPGSGLSRSGLVGSAPPNPDNNKSSSTTTKWDGRAQPVGHRYAARDCRTWGEARAAGGTRTCTRLAWDGQPIGRRPECGGSAWGRVRAGGTAGRSAGPPRTGPPAQCPRTRHIARRRRGRCIWR